MANNKTILLNLLHEYDPSDPHQQKIRAEIIEFVKNHDDCFLRSNLAGHITGSCWLLSPNGQDVLLTHHKKIGQWLQLGGHADGDPDLLAVALREAQEESGMVGITPVSAGIFDLDIHLIPAYNDVPAHFHLDIRFVLQAPHLRFQISDESHALAWKSILSIANTDDSNESLRRMAKKWLKTIPLKIENESIFP